MPELPEVETVVRDLRPLLAGRRFSSVWVGPLPLRRPWQPDWQESLIGRRVTEIRRRGKWIVLVLDGGCFLVVHLGMTGQLRVFAASEAQQPHTHLRIDLDRGGSQLRFRDIRRFGSVSYFLDQNRLEEFFTSSGLGPEPFNLTPKYWRDRLAATARCLKAVLLDQRVVAGVGNIYSDETLFQARLHPCRVGKDLAFPESRRLSNAIRIVLNRAILQRGSSIRDYVGGTGQRGNFQNEFRVYGQTGKPCCRCRTPIERIRLAGRSTHFCPCCQCRFTPSR